MESGKKLRKKEIAFGAVALVIFGVLYTSAIGSYQTETNNRTALVSMPAPSNPDHVTASARVLSVDPVKGEMTLRISFVPHGGLTRDGELTHDLALFVNAATGGQNRTFPKAKDMSPIDVVIDMEGLATDYPFDHHTAKLELYLTQPVKDADPIEIDLATGFFGSIPGLKVGASLDAASKGNHNFVNVEVSRSSTIVTLVIFAMGLMWFITLTVLFVFLSVVVRGRKVEFGMFGFAAGFLFSFVAFRNAMPGVAPIGTLSDYLSFFWGYAIISISLIGLVITWLIRPTK